MKHLQISHLGRSINLLTFSVTSWWLFCSAAEGQRWRKDHRSHQQAVEWPVERSLHRHRQLWHPVSAGHGCEDEGCSLGSLLPNRTILYSSFSKPQATTISRLIWCFCFLCRISCSSRRSGRPTSAALCSHKWTTLDVLQLCTLCSCSFSFVGFPVCLCGTFRCYCFIQTNSLFLKTSQSDLYCCHVGNIPSTPESLSVPFLNN